MSFNLSTKCVIAGLLLYLVAVHVIAEAKTYTKLICKTSDLGNDDLVTVVKGEELIAECFYQEGKCSNTPNTVGRLTEQSGYLVLIIQNINPLDHYDAYRWDRSGKTLLLKNFTLDEEQPLTTAAISTKEEETLGTNETNTTVSEERNHRITYSFIVGFIGVTAGVIVIICYKKKKQNNPIAEDPEDPGEETRLNSNTDGAGEPDTGEDLEMVVVDTTLSVDNEEEPELGA